MDFIVAALKKSRSASYADIAKRAAKRRLKVFPIMFGRAQAMLGIVKSARRGEGKHARAKADSRVPTGTGRRGPQRRSPGQSRPAAAAAATAADSGFDTLLAAVRDQQQDLAHYRAALDRIRSILADALG